MLGPSHRTQADTFEGGPSRDPPDVSGQRFSVSLHQRPFAKRPAVPSLPSPRSAFFRRSPHRITRMREMKLQDLKSKSPTELLVFAEEHSVENASTMRKQELMFA